MCSVVVSEVSEETVLDSNQPSTVNILQHNMFWRASLYLSRRDLGLAKKQ